MCLMENIIRRGEKHFNFFFGDFDRSFRSAGKEIQPTKKASVDKAKTL